MPSRPSTFSDLRGGRPRRRGRLAAAFAVVGVVVLASCNDDGRTLRPARSDQDQSISTTSSSVALDDSDELPAPGIVPGQPLGSSSTSPAIVDIAPLAIVAPWRDGGAIDARFTCDGADVSPALSWFGVPPDAAELAIAVTDDDSDGFVHWAVAGLPPIDGVVPEGAVPASLAEAANDFSTSGAPVVGWRGPCPPPGSGPHTYRFTLFALNPGIELPDGTPAVDMLTAIREASVASAVVTGTYER